MSAISNAKTYSLFIPVPISLQIVSFSFELFIVLPFIFQIDYFFNSFTFQLNLFI